MNETAIVPPDNSTDDNHVEKLITKQESKKTSDSIKLKRKIILIASTSALFVVLASAITFFFIFNKQEQAANYEEEKCSEASEDYLIKFDVAGGKAIAPIKVCEECDSHQLLPTPVSEDKIFSGWYYDSKYHNMVLGDKVFDVKRSEIKNDKMCIIGYDDIVLYAKWVTVETEDMPTRIINSNEELYSELNQLMANRGYNEYAVRVINSFIPDYQKLFTNNEIYDLFYKVEKITINPYDPENPNLSQDQRAYNAGGNIVVNCFAGELDNDGNFDGLRWLLTHEIMHSLGDFPDEYTDGSFGVYTSRNSLLEEGLADSIAHFVKGTAYDTGYDINEPHAYNMSGDIIMLFEKIGCYDAIIHANMNHSFSGLRACMVNKINNGDEYFKKLFKQINKLFLYIEYPNNFPSKEDLVNRYSYMQNPELINFIQNNTLSELWGQYEALSKEIMNNKL